MKKKPHNLSFVPTIIFICTLLICRSCKKVEEKVEDKLFTPAGTITDIEGNVYSLIEIGTQKWMAQNLRTTKFSDGTNIPSIVGGKDWHDMSSPAYVIPWLKPDATFYNWYTVNTGKLCPTGWHIPTSGDWATLIDYLGGESIAGGKLKDIDINCEDNENIGATNESGFSGKPYGYRSGYIEGAYGFFTDISRTANFWTSTESSKEKALTIIFGCRGTNVLTWDFEKNSGLNIRCVKDN